MRSWQPAGWRDFDGNLRRRVKTAVKHGFGMEFLDQLYRKEVADPPSRAWVLEQLSMVSTQWVAGDHFSILRLLERLEDYCIPHDETYVLAMMGAFGDRGRTGVPEFFIRHDSEIRELVWKFFEIEGNPQVSLTNVERTKAPGGGWLPVFLTLVADGTLPRDRVLSSCLRALNRDFSAYRAGWFARLYTELKPAASETAADQVLLIPLLGSSVTATVSFASKQVARVHRAGLLDGPAFLGNCAPALLGTKAAAMPLVKIVQQLATTDLLMVALGNSHPDVQAAAAHALRALGEERAIDAAESLSPSVRRKFGGPAPSAEIAVESPVSIPSRQAFAKWDGEEILERTGYLLEGGGNALDYERAVAAWSQLTDPQVLQPLTSRAEAVFERAYGLQAMVALAVLISAGAEVDDVVLTDVPYALNWLRFFEVARVLAGTEPARPLLATPQDDAGWISPSDLVKRLSELHAANLDPWPADLTAALLRISPTGRPDALAELDAITNTEAVQVVRYALGGEPAPIRTVCWWVAAGRSRSPEQPDQLLLAAGLALAGQGNPVGSETSSNESPTDWLNRPTRTHQFRMDGSDTWIVDQPTVLKGIQVNSARPWAYPDVGVLAIEWAANGYPHSAELAAGYGIAHLFAEATTSEILDTCTTTLQNLENHPGHWGTLSTSCLVFGLAARTVAVRTHAAELFAVVVPGRVAPGEVATVMARWAHCCVLTRWATALSATADISQAAPSVVDLLTDLLPQLDRGHRGLFALLQVLLDETIRIGRSVADPALRHWLGNFVGSSKASKLARSLLALSS